MLQTVPKVIKHHGKNGSFPLPSVIPINNGIKPILFKTGTIKCISLIFKIQNNEVIKATQIRITNKSRLSKIKFLDLIIETNT
ncbi:MAG: hypothetical protein WAZ12_01765 [Candidatus Absconditicoccaceae bacterium]